MSEAPNPDPMQYLRSLWGSMGIPAPGLMTPTLDVGEIEKRIADLKSVEKWLDMNLTLLRTSIHGLEMQKATLNMMQQGVSGLGMAGGTAGGTAGGAAPPPIGNPVLDAWLKAMQAQVAPDNKAGKE